MSELRELCDAFLRVSANAQGWGSDDTERWEPDCDAMSMEFIDWLAAERGVPARLVHVVPSEAAAGLMVGDHWFAAVGQFGVDWTARQFYNVWYPPINWRMIAFPLIFPWPGRYPLVGYVPAK